MRFTFDLVADFIPDVDRRSNLAPTTLSSRSLAFVLANFLELSRYLAFVFVLPCLKFITRWQNS